MVVLALLGLASVIVITLAVANLYDHQRETDVKLCYIVQAEWHQIQRLGRKTGVQIPPTPPPCPRRHV